MFLAIHSEEGHPNQPAHTGRPHPFRPRPPGPAHPLSYHSTEEVEIVREHVFEIVGDENAANVQFDVAG